MTRGTMIIGGLASTLSLAACSLPDIDIDVTVGDGPGVPVLEAVTGVVQPQAGYRVRQLVVPLGGSASAFEGDLWIHLTEAGQGFASGVVTHRMGKQLEFERVALGGRFLSDQSVVMLLGVNPGKSATLLVDEAAFGLADVSSGTRTVARAREEGDSVHEKLRLGSTHLLMDRKLILTIVRERSGVGIRVREGADDPDSDDFSGLLDGDRVTSGQYQIVLMDFDSSHARVLIERAGQP